MSASNIHVISLRRSEKRREGFNRINGHLEFTFFDAVDGRTLTEETTRNPELFSKELTFTPERYGVALSHLGLWEKAARENRIVTIAEDDAIFRLDFEEQWQKAVEKLPPDWDMVFWGWNFDSVLSLHIMPGVSPVAMIFSQKKLRQTIAKFREFTEPPTLLRVDKCFGIHAYSMSPKGAARFKSLCFPIGVYQVYFPGLNQWLPNYGFDVSVSKYYRETNTFCAFPPLAASLNEHESSTIQLDLSVNRYRQR